jgi:hypothetical protein
LSINRAAGAFSSAAPAFLIRLRQAALDHGGGAGYMSRPGIEFCRSREVIDLLLPVA